MKQDIRKTLSIIGLLFIGSAFIFFLIAIASLWSAVNAKDSVMISSQLSTFVTSITLSGLNFLGAIITDKLLYK